MKTSLTSLIFTFALAFAAGEAEAAKRFGGGGNLGKQRATPTQKEATPAPAQAPAQAAPAAAPAAAGAAGAAAKPSFMSRWGGVLAGLGIGALLASMFGAQLGPIVGLILMAMLAAAIAFMLYRLFTNRRGPATSPQFSPQPRAATATAFQGQPPQGSGFSGIGSQVGAPMGATAEPTQKPDIDNEAFVRVAKTSFIRLQAANDAKDLNDIRDYTTPEMYAELSMQVADRGDAPQRTEVVSVNAQVVDSAIEGDYEIVSVRFTGLIRENDAANPEPYDEIWHVRKDRRDRKGAWLIAGIQQVD